MSDKYRNIAKEIWNEIMIPPFTGGIPDPEPFLLAHLMKALELYDSRREAETCEWLWNDENRKSITACFGDFTARTPWRYCPICGHRIVGKK